MKKEKLAISPLRPGVASSKWYEAAKNISIQMQASGWFPDPPIPYPAFDAAVDKLGKDIVKSFGGSLTDIAAKNVSLKTVQVMLRQMNLYVNFIAMGDVDKIASSGFPVSKTPVRHLTLEEPKVLRTDYGNLEGSVKLKWSGVNGRQWYEIQISTNPESPESWNLAETTSANRIQIQNLLPGELYYFRVRAKNARSISGWSQQSNQRAA